MILARCCALLLLVPLGAHVTRYGTDGAWLLALCFALPAVLAQLDAARGIAAAVALAFCVPILPVACEVFPFAAERVVLFGALVGLAWRPPESAYGVPRPGVWLSALFVALVAATWGSALFAFGVNLPEGSGWLVPALVAHAGDLLVPRSSLDPGHPLTVAWLRSEALLVTWLVLDRCLREPRFPLTLARALGLAVLLGVAVTWVEVWRGLEFRGQPWSDYLARGIPRSHRPLTDNNALGTALVLVMPILASGALVAWRERLRVGRFVALGALAAALLFLYSARSKAALGAFVLSVPVFVALCAGFAALGRRFALGAVAAAGVLVVVGIQLLPDSALEPLARGRRGEDLVRALRLEAATDYLRDYRSSPWSGARSMIAEAPALGVGLGRFPLLLAEHRDPSLEVPFAPDHENAHSQPLQVLAEQGVLGASLELLLFALAALGALRVAARGGEGALVAAGYASGLLALGLNLTVSHSLLELAPAYLCAGAVGVGLAGWCAAASHTRDGSPPRWPIFAACLPFALALLPLATAGPRERANAGLGVYPWYERPNTAGGRDRLLGPDARWFQTWLGGDRVVIPVKDVRPVTLPGDAEARLFLNGEPVGEPLELPRAEPGQVTNPIAYLKADRPAGVERGDLVELRIVTRPATSSTAWFDSGRNAIGLRMGQPGFVAR